MNKLQTTSTVAVFAVVLLLTGCGNSLTPEQKYQERYGKEPEKTAPASKSPSSKAAVQDKQTEQTNQIKSVGGLISLTAKSTGPGTVDLTWNLADEIPLSENTRVYLLYGTSPDPLHDKTTFWWRHHYTKTNATWDGIPPGTLYFRACVSDTEECDIYSDDIKLEISN